MLSFFPLDVLDEIWDVIESVSEGFLTHSFKRRSVVHQEKKLVVLIHDPSVKRNLYYQECAGHSHFRPFCLEVGSTIRKRVIVLPLHYGSQVQNLQHYHKKSSVFYA